MTNTKSNMKPMKEEIRKLINPDLSKSTIDTYVSQIHNAYHKMFPEETNKFNKNLLTFENIKEFGESLNNINTRKTIYSAFMQVVDDKTKQKLLPLMLTEINKYKEKINAGVPSKNPITMKTIKKVLNQLKKECAPLLKEKGDLSTFQLFCLQKLITVAICSGVFIAPRRNMDYQLMKINNIDKEKDNYIDHKTKEFVFNKYKTMKSYGQQRVDIPEKLYKMIVLYIKHKIKNSDFLISQRKGEPFISATFTQFINSIFKDYGKISNNSFRHAYLTEKYSNTKSLSQDLKDMGTSIKQLETYVD